MELVFPIVQHTMTDYFEVLLVSEVQRYPSCLYIKWPLTAGHECTVNEDRYAVMADRNKQLDFISMIDDSRFLNVKRSF